MKCYDMNKNDNIQDYNLKLTNLLKSYFRNLAENDLTYVCQDIVIKFNENKQLEKLKIIKKLFIYKKQENKNRLLKYFFNWKKNIFFKKSLKEKNYNSKELHNSKSQGNNLIYNDSISNNSYTEQKYISSNFIL